MKTTCWMIVLLIGSLGSQTNAETGGDPDGKRNLADESKLPEGQGIAAKFAGDIGIEQHAAVIFADNFEIGEIGSKWDESRNENNHVLSWIDESKSNAWLGKRTLKVTSDLKNNTGGGMTKWFESNQTIFIRFYVKFDKHCDYVHHFCTLRANKSLQGGERWSGFGGAGVKPVGDERFSTALEPWGDWGKNEPPGRWNFYSYWHEMEASPDKKYWGNAFRIAQPQPIKPDQWICCEFMLQHNTPGNPDGEQAYWTDGQLRGHWQGINWRTNPRLMANAFTLESYVTDRWTKNQINEVYFDNVVIAKEYIGPTSIFSRRLRELSR